MIYRFSGFGLLMSLSDNTMQAAKIVESTAANVTVITAGFSLSIALQHIQSVISIIAGLLACICTIYFIIVHIRNAKKLELESKLLERKLRDDINKTENKNT